MMRKQIPALVTLISLTGGVSIAQVFAAGEKDLKESSKVSFSISDEVERSNLSKKINSLLTYRNNKDEARYAAVSKEIKDALRDLEKQVKSATEAEFAINLLNNVAFTYCPFRPRWAQRSPVNEEDFAQGQYYKLRAMALQDIYHNDKKSQIRAHRELLNWYSSMNKAPQAEQQTKILSKLLGSSDPNVINPPPPPCPACGMG